jgi:hypothetical protein
MSTVYGVVGVFEDGEHLVHAARSAREAGYTKLDACTPFPVHGIDEAMAIPRSKLGYFVATVGSLGAISALLLIWWTGLPTGHRRQALFRFGIFYPHHV